MRKESLATLTLAVVLLFVTPLAVAEAPDAFDLIGEDPEEDADNYAVNDAAQLTETFSRGKQDILELGMTTDEETPHIELLLAASHIGTSSLLFVVQFIVADERYDVCWNIQSAGTTAESVDVNEDMTLSCSRINDSTGVGPSTREDGIEVTTNDDGQGVVYWPVPRSELGDPADGDEITEIVATTWNRGVNPSGAPSTSPQSQYIWNPADRAPDEGSWSYVFGGLQDEIDLNVTLAADNTTLRLAPGGNTTLQAQAQNGGGQNATLALNVSAPEGINVDFGDNTTLELTGNQTTDFEFDVHADPSMELNTTHPFNLTLEKDNETIANLTFTLEIVSSDKVMEPTHPQGEEGEAVNETELDNDETGFLAGPTPLAFIAIAVAWGALARRLRDNTGRFA